MTDTADKRFSAINVSAPWRGLSVFPSGTVDGEARLALAYLYGGLAAAPPVEVPDVVGQSQASGTAELEGEGFVVAVETAHSSIVPAGDIISQSPTAGSFAAEGSTVTITVSLGEAPVAEETFSGGFVFAFERERLQRERRRKKRHEDEEEARQAAEAAADAVQAEIAALLHQKQAQEAERLELDRLRKLVHKFADAKAEGEMSERVQTAFTRAATAQTVSSLLALEREVRRMLEEEELAVLMALLLDD